MSIVGGLDLHRRQLTYDHISLETGEIERGRIVPGDREHLRPWLARFAGEEDVEFAVEGCTGWRYVVDELARAEIQAHMADPAELSARKGPKRRAKTDRVDARQLRGLLSERRLPESWIAPEHVLEARGRHVSLRHSRPMRSGRSRPHSLARCRARQARPAHRPRGAA